MDYRKIYNNLIEKAKSRGLDKKSVDYYSELHHIVPRCLGGDNSPENLVMLSAREHFIAHMLLWKAYPEKHSLRYAAMMMANRFDFKINSKVYSRLREEFSKSVSDRRRGKSYKDLVGQKFTKLTVIELESFYISPKGGRSVKWLCECDCGNTISVVSGSLTSKNTQSCGCLVVESGKARSGENNHMWGKKHSEETKAKFKLRPIKRGEEHPSFGRKLTDEQRKRLSEINTGKKWTQEQRDKFMLSARYGEDHHMFGNSHPPEVLAKISATLKARDQRPWENIATQTEESMLKWAMADYYYDFWVFWDKPGLKKLTKIYNEIHNDQLSLSFFTNPRLKFISGWVPKEDEKWVVFSEQALKEAG